LRIGVGHPGVKAAVPHYVLHDFPKEDADWLTPLIDAIADNAPLFAEGKDNTIANRLHAAMTPEKAAEKTESKSVRAPAAPQDKSAEGPLASRLKKLFGL
jgi:PTH1 family peptidyl-tRNA hydrolase